MGEQVRQVVEGPLLAIGEENGQVVREFRQDLTAGATGGVSRSASVTTTRAWSPPGRSSP